MTCMIKVNYNFFSIILFLTEELKYFLFLCVCEIIAFKSYTSKCGRFKKDCSDLIAAEKRKEKPDLVELTKLGPKNLAMFQSYDLPEPLDHYKEEPCLENPKKKKQSKRKLEDLKHDCDTCGGNSV